MRASASGHLGSCPGSGSRVGGWPGRRRSRLRARRGRRAAGRVGALPEDREIVAAGGEEAVHRHPVDGVVGRPAAPSTRQVDDPLARRARQIVGEAQVRATAAACSARRRCSSRCRTAARARRRIWRPVKLLTTRLLPNGWAAKIWPKVTLPSPAGSRSARTPLPLMKAIWRRREPRRVAARWASAMRSPQHLLARSASSRFAPGRSAGRRPARRSGRPPPRSARRAPRPPGRAGSADSGRSAADALP